MKGYSFYLSIVSLIAPSRTSVWSMYEFACAHAGKKVGKGRPNLRCACAYLDV